MKTTTQLFKSGNIFILTILIGLVGAACSDNPSGPEVKDPDTAPEASIDRFSDEAGNLFKRSANSALPGINAPIDFDMAPFITKGLGPDGEMSEYYNFDVMPTAPAPIYVLFREGEDTPVEGQLNIVNVIPGDEGYNDFWRVTKVTVPSNYEANTITSYSGLAGEGYEMETTNMLVNCPIVPKGSSADKRFTSAESKELMRGWYDDQIVYYFTFQEKALATDSNGLVPLSPIYVTFNVNPGQEGGGPPSGFVTEMSSDQTHNVPATLPNDNDYSPLWMVNIFDNADFSNVSDLSSAQSANILAQGAAIVNCPIVEVNI